MFFLTPTSLPNDMCSAQQPLQASAFVTMDAEIRVMTSHCFPCTQGWE